MFQIRRLGAEVRLPLFYSRSQSKSSCLVPKSPKQPIANFMFSSGSSFHTLPSPTFITHSLLEYFQFFIDFTPTHSFTLVTFLNPSNNASLYDPSRALAAAPLASAAKGTLGFAIGTRMPGRILHSSCSNIHTYKVLRPLV